MISGISCMPLCTIFKYNQLSQTWFLSGLTHSLTHTRVRLPLTVCHWWKVVYLFLSVLSFNHLDGDIKALLGADRNLALWNSSQEAAITFGMSYELWVRDPPTPTTAYLVRYKAVLIMCLCSVWQVPAHTALHTQVSSLYFWQCFLPSLFFLKATCDLLMSFLFFF